MSVRFILGRSGVGKTKACIDAIVEGLAKSSDGPPLVLLVPEQATYQAERTILADRNVPGYNRLHVLSFDRLSFLLLGKNTVSKDLSAIGRQMVVHRLLREHQSSLKILDPSARQAGLARQMADTIAELNRYAKTPEDIDQLLTKLETSQESEIARRKFADIGLIFNEYLNFIEDRFLDPNIQFNRALKEVGNKGFIEGASLWVDGFAGFTGCELEMLAELMKAASQTHIALCLDPEGIDLSNPSIDKLDTGNMFYPTRRTYAELVEIIKKCKLELMAPVTLKNPERFSNSQPLAHIEQNIFKYETATSTSADAVKVVSAPSVRDEIQFVARQIRRLVCQNNWRYRDIAVIASDIETYEHYIRASFDDYGIPFFIDKRKGLDQHPVIQLVRSSLSAAVGGFSTSDVFAYLKTGLAPIDEGDINLLENYCIAFGIKGSHWQDQKPWDFAGSGDSQFDDRAINTIRIKAIKPLLKLHHDLCGHDGQTAEITSEQFTRVLFNFLDELSIRETIGRWIEEANGKNDLQTSEEHQQFYNIFVDLFDEFTEVFAGRQISCRDFLEIIDSAFSQLTLAFIPPKLDQVLVGSIERSRHPDLKAVFLTGVTQKQFPIPISYTGILADNERELAQEVGLEIAPPMRLNLTERQYLSYIAFTRPSDFLCLTYPATDEKGSPVARSESVDYLESLFDDLTAESTTDSTVDIETIYSQSELSDLLCSRLGKDSDLTESNQINQLTRLLQEISSDRHLKETAAKISFALKYNNHAVLSEQIISSLFGNRLKSSASKLSDFAACPYKHYAKYILNLKQRKEFKFKPLDIGDFYHRVLDALTKQLIENGRDFASIDKEQLLKILDQKIAQLIEHDSFISSFRRHSVHNEFIISSACDNLSDCVLAIAQMIGAGDFRPVCSELSFGRTSDDFDAYTLTLSNGHELFLAGKIDRLDIAEINGEKVGLIFDYKRKDKSFNWSDFYNGLDMQLAIYMLAAANWFEAKHQAEKIVGAFFVPVEAELGKAPLGKLPDKEKTFNYKAKGIFNGEFFRHIDNQVSGNSKFYNFFVKDDAPYGDYDRRGSLKPDDFENVLKFARTKIIELAENILSGMIELHPFKKGGKTACQYCDYKSVCRFDWQINQYNTLETPGKNKVLEIAGGYDG